MIFAAQPYGLPLKEVTIAQYLKALGYKTHAVGKVVIMTIILKCFDCNASENQWNIHLSSYIYFSLHKTRHLELSLSSEIFQKLLWDSRWAIFECNINQQETVLEAKIPIYGSRLWGLPFGFSALVLMVEMKIETVKNDHKNWGAWAKLLLDGNRLFEKFWTSMVLLNPFLFASRFLEFFPRSRVSVLLFFFSPLCDQQVK